MPNPMVTLQLAGVYDQLVVARVPSPPVGFKPFKVRVKEAMLWVPGRRQLPKEFRMRLKNQAIICPECGAPKRQDSEWGWIWIIGDDNPLMEPGNIQQCRVCWCLVWGQESMFAHTSVGRTFYYRPMPKGMADEQPRDSTACGDV